MSRPQLSLAAAPAPAPHPLRAEIAALQPQLPCAGDPADAAELLALLRLLYGVGRRDLPLGRLFEGHVDAQQIVGRYGSPAQVAAYRAALAEGAAGGVWNADLPGEPLRLGGAPGAWRLSGGKGFASGAGVLSHALVTADAEGGRQLLLLDLQATPPAIDDGWWRVVGMQRSETHIVRWSDAPIPDAALIGPVNAYVTEPWFSGGALRFAAVQAGGVAGLFDRVRDHLAAAGRAADPHQAGRLAALHGHAQAAAGAVAHAAAAYRTGRDELLLARVAAARVAVGEAADAALTLAQQAVGVQGLFQAHPLAAQITDLMVYLRQPAPDAQRMKAGAAAAAGLLTPGL